MSIGINRVLLVITIASLGLACAGLGSNDRPMSFQPRGPGILYDSIEAAAVDGLAYSHKLARESQQTNLMYGGTVHAVPGGYSYGEVTHASEEEPLRLTHRLRKNDVAQFHTYPRPTVFGQNRQNERPSRADRQTVDRHDPFHRPLFILTPKLMVRAYHGRQVPLQEVAYIGPLDEGIALAGSPTD